MKLSERISTVVLDVVNKYQQELDESGVIAQFQVTVKVNDRQQIVETLPAITRRYRVEGVNIGG